MIATLAILYARCARCNQTKPVVAFQKNRQRKTGLSAYCKPCLKERQREYIKKNPDKWRAAQRRWAQKNREMRATSGRRLYWKDPEKARVRIIESRRRIQAKDPSYLPRKRKEYYKRNPEKTFARKKCWYAVKTGKLPRPDTLPCIRCGKTAEQYHHHNGYDRAHVLDVVPVCRLCHEAIEHKTGEHT